MSHGKGLEDRVIALGIQTCLSKTGVGYGDCFVHLPMYHQDRNRAAWPRATMRPPGASGPDNPEEAAMAQQQRGTARADP